MNDLPPRDHNQPQPLALLLDQLAVENEAFRKRADELLASYAAMPEEIDKASIAVKATDLAALMGACRLAVEGARVARKAPHLKAGRVIDDFFQGRLLDPMDEARDAIKDRLRSWLLGAVNPEVRGDQGSLATLRSHWTYRKYDGAKIDLEVLRPYIDIDKALRAAIAAGLRDIDGADIYEDRHTQIR